VELVRAMDFEASQQPRVEMLWARNLWKNMENSALIDDVHHYIKHSFRLGIYQPRLNYN